MADLSRLRTEEADFDHIMSEVKKADKLMDDIGGAWYSFTQLLDQLKKNMGRERLDLLTELQAASDRIDDLERDHDYERRRADALSDEKHRAWEKMEYRVREQMRELQKKHDAEMAAMRAEVAAAKFDREQVLAVLDGRQPSVLEEVHAS